MILNKHSNVKTRGIIKGGMFGGMGKWMYWPRIYEYQMYKSVITDAKCDPKHNLIFSGFCSSASPRSSSSFPSSR